MKVLMSFLGLILFSSLSFSQTKEKGLIYKQNYWLDGSHYNSAGNYDRHDENVIIFVSDKKIYLTIGTKKRTFNINSTTQDGTQGWTYSCTSKDGKKYNIGYGIMTFNTTTYMFSFEKIGDKSEIIYVEKITENDVERVD